MDVCKALEINDSHPEALEMKQDLERKAVECKNQVRRVAIPLQILDSLLAGHSKKFGGE